MAPNKAPFLARAPQLLDRGPFHGVSGIRKLTATVLYMFASEPMGPQDG